MKQAVFVVVFFLVNLAARASEGLPPPPPQIESVSSMLVDMSSNQILAAANADLRVEPASLTKLMVSYLVFDALARKEIDAGDEYAVTEEAVKTGGSRMFAKQGQKIKVDDLLSGLIIQSANDAALTLAAGLTGSEGDFVGKMNELARKLGMSSTHFANATGMPHPEHLTTAGDMTLLASALIRHFPEQYKRYFAQREFTFNGLRQQNRNRLLWLDSTVDGVKTGHTASAGYCLIASAQRGKRRLLATVIGARSDADRAMYAQKLLNYGFLETESIRYYRAGKPVTVAPVYKGSKSQIPIGFQNDFTMTFSKGVSARVKAQMITRQPYIAPIQKGQALGTLRLILDGKVLGDYPLVALDDVPVGGWFGRFWDGLRLLFK